MSYDKLKGEAKLDYKKLDNGETEYSVYDDNCFICGTLGCNKGKLKEMIQRSNEHRELKEKVERSCAICGVVDDLKKESKKLKEENKELWEIAEEFRDISKQELDKNDKLSARNRELAEELRYLFEMTNWMADELDLAPDEEGFQRILKTVKLLEEVLGKCEGVE